MARSDRGGRGARDPRRSLVIGGALALLVLVVLAALVLVGIWTVFSVRRDPRGLGSDSVASWASCHQIDRRGVVEHVDPSSGAGVDVGI